MTISNRLHFHDFQPALGDIKDDVLSGLQTEQKVIAPKYFYDAHGSKLFDRICRLPEYYLTRTEIGLLKQYGSEIAECIGSGATLFELGSGSSSKIRLLLDAVRPSIYVPMDISKEHLFGAASSLANDYDWLEIHAVCIDYSNSWQLPRSLQGNRRIAYFPGSSIGNLHDNEAHALLKRIAELVGVDGGLLIGVDLIKNVKLLEAAYNDRQQVTAAFNKNLLTRLNRELNADFRLERFEHQAFYNRDMNRIEMHLSSICSQFIQVAGQRFHFRAGETIHTENSYKYSIAGFHQLALRSGFAAVKVWVDRDNLFSIHYLESRR
ncbi:L-histidine N(alpha)-methyltransferase [Methylomarinum sp. Ch1-1]|uniref:L-histidine N(Alpha)-methyltransferase n=1 Tax=Methylomarinum roseum TaxID=3067653 RepID=A0AAU7NZY0_9GAMM|nr:L-histidine N(alpha)-methyltransferase [Methylomarinum sp. Ch1-1]MDP4521784.1 L-histidine N(alpha)-methyltransferase [Methylomarinum sp. Ch1-1]